MTRERARELAEKIKLAWDAREVTVFPAGEGSCGALWSTSHSDWQLSPSG
jgi:hypothetical protein